MDLRSFIGLYASLLAVLALTFPVGAGFARRPPDAHPAPGSASRCYVLTYADTAHGAYYPRGVRLESRIAYGGQARGPGYIWYHADPAVDDRPAFNGHWYPAGPDSADVMAWHHAPFLRIPLRGGWGYGSAPYYPNLVLAILEPSIAVHASPTTCVGFRTARQGPNER